MKMKSEWVFLLGFLAVMNGCGMNQGRKAALEAGTGSTGAEIRLEKLAAEKAAPFQMVGYRCLGTFASNSLPADIVKAEQGEQVGNAILEVEAKTFAATYEKEIVPSVARGKVKLSAPVVMMKNQAQIALCVQATPETETQIYREEVVNVLSESEIFCSKVLQPAYPEHVLSCDHELDCSGMFMAPHWTFGMHVRKYQAVLQNIPGSKCIATLPHYRKRTVENNTSRAIEARIQVYQSFSNSAGKILVFRL